MESSPGQSEILQGPLEALVATWQDNPTPLCAQPSPYISHKVYHLQRKDRVICGLDLLQRSAVWGLQLALAKHSSADAPGQDHHSCHVYRCLYACA